MDLVLLYFLSSISFLLRVTGTNKTILYSTTTTTTLSKSTTPSTTIVHHTITSSTTIFYSTTPSTITVQHTTTTTTILSPTTPVSSRCCPVVRLDCLKIPTIGNNISSSCPSKNPPTGGILFLAFGSYTRVGTSQPNCAGFGPNTTYLYAGGVYNYSFYQTKDGVWGTSVQGCSGLHLVRGKTGGQACPEDFPVHGWEYIDYNDKWHDDPGIYLSCITPTPTTPPPSTTTTSPDYSLTTDPTNLLLFILGGFCLLVLVVSVVGCFLYKKKHRQPPTQQQQQHQQQQQQQQQEQEQ